MTIEQSTFQYKFHKLILSSLVLLWKKKVLAMFNQSFYWLKLIKLLITFNLAEFLVTGGSDELSDNSKDLCVAV